MAKKDENDEQAIKAGAQEQADTEQEQGYVGTKVDETPNENYTVSGVTSGAETPETTTEDTGGTA